MHGKISQFYADYIWKKKKKKKKKKRTIINGRLIRRTPTGKQTDRSDKWLWDHMNEWQYRKVVNTLWQERMNVVTWNTSKYPICIVVTNCEHSNFVVNVDLNYSSSPNMAEENNNSRNNNNHGNQTKIGCNYSHDRQPTGYFHFLRSYYLFLVTVVRQWQLFNSQL